ncbi:chemotaxis protein CheB [Fulvimarina sp. 2208YS6-2-32]|uniref:chemotaxis protein CheB n=1 Tax=Fulvimarina uroteuthidis TaxID=3098149 RepID=UPI002AC92AC1|nr:chemotaxis protein CheB [Fulvimarina sp. 2208YS6-2-32]
MIGVGASAGGLEAIREMLGAVQSRDGFAFVVVQHLDPTHDSLLAELLGRHTGMNVRQVSGGERVEGGNVYIIPPGHGLAIKNGRLKLTDFVQPRGMRRPIDDFFESLARDQGGNAACVILSGTGADGTTGLRAIKEHGGLCIAQDPETARYDGMPVSAVGTGLVDFIRAPNEIAECLQTFFDRRDDGRREEAAKIVADHVDDMCSTLQDLIGHDFSGYKRSTLVRRIERRMKVLDIETPQAYLARIQSSSEECDALFRDLLINVTRFFRDPEMFEALREKVIVPLVERTAPNTEIRVWIPGCSSGEEAYTIAVLFADALRGRQERPYVQIFATDIDERMLAIAREGRYPLSAMGDIPEALREHYTIGQDGVFQMAPKVRDMVRFSSHSLIKDPPFSRVDLLSCRNLLIYFDEDLQRQVFPILNYALKEGGFLFLGPSESIGRHEDMFLVTDPKARIFERREGRSVYPIRLSPNVARGSVRRVRHRSADTGFGSSWEEGFSTRRILDRYAPATVVANRDGEIMSSNGRLAKYLEFPHGTSGSVFVTSIARPGLREVLPGLLRQAIEEKKRTIARDVSVHAEFGRQSIDVIADPLPDGTALIVFKDTAPFESGDDDEMVDLGPADTTTQQLEDELRLTRHRLRSAVEELETANEELKSSNEEMMSMNEELQSTNEELSTVNDELKSKVDQLTVANSDLRNFFDSTRLAVVVVDRNLRIRNFTDAALDVFPLQSGDRGRSLSDVASHLSDDRFLHDARVVAAGGEPTLRTISSKDDMRKWSMRVMPYRDLDGTIEGATIVLTDITNALGMQAELDAERERLEMAIRVAGIGVWEYQVDSGDITLNANELDFFGLASDRQTTNIEQLLAMIDPEDRPAVEASLRRAIAGEGNFESLFRVNRADGETVHLKGYGRLIPDSNPKRLMGVSYDVTSEAHFAEQREFMLREMNHRVKNLFAVISSIVTGSARAAETPAELAKDVRERIAALGRAHSLTHTSSSRARAPLKDLLTEAVEPYQDGRSIRIEGPDVTIEIDKLTPLALVLHEWATNAAKYGSLGENGGRLDISWNHNRDDSLMIDWREIFDGGYPEDDDKQVGFGSRLIEFSVKQLRASLDVEQMATERRMKLKVPNIA